MKTSLSLLSKTLTQINNETKMKSFLDGLLTPQEIDELSCRLKIVKHLQDHVPQRDIAKKLGVGVATVSRGAREIKLGKFNFAWWNTASW